MQQQVTWVFTKGKGYRSWRQWPWLLTVLT